mmetsp:Transcript_11002/g.15503  ORF Transcript_11002/g.15503 Transcript_11002/m.15503 type:complete len:265 (-) Transcript_11002:312-1106(-)
MKTTKSNRKVTKRAPKSKKPLTSYNLFFRDEHQRMIKTRDPEVESPMLSRIIGNRWRDLDAATRCRYQIMAAKLMTEHENRKSKNQENKNNCSTTDSPVEIDADSLYEALKTSNAAKSASCNSSYEYANTTQQTVLINFQESKFPDKLCKPSALRRAATPESSTSLSSSAFQFPIDEFYHERPGVVNITPSPSPITVHGPNSSGDWTVPFSLQKMLCYPLIEPSPDDLMQERISFSIKTTQAFLDDELVHFASFLGTDCLSKEC